MVGQPEHFKEMFAGVDRYRAFEKGAFISATGEERRDFKSSEACKSLVVFRSLKNEVFIFALAMSLGF